MAAFTRSTANRIPIALRIAEMLVSSGFPPAESVRERIFTSSPYKAASFGVAFAPAKSHSSPLSSVQTRSENALNLRRIQLRFLSGHLHAVRASTLGCFAI
jgi:hypothetical protein